MLFTKELLENTAATCHANVTTKTNATDPWAVPIDFSEFHRPSQNSNRACHSDSDPWSLSSREAAAEVHVAPVVATLSPLEVPNLLVAAAVPLEVPKLMVAHAASPTALTRVPLMVLV